MQENLRAEDRLDSWKNIAAFLGRDERTAKRWEKERQLPVHRVPGQRGVVFAYKPELLQWFHSDAPQAPPEPASAEAAASGATYPGDALLLSRQEGNPAPAVDAATPAATRPQPTRRLRRFSWAGVCALALLAAAISAVHRHAQAVARPPSAAARTQAAPVGSPQAHDLYLQGRYFWEKRTPDNLSKALAAFEESIRQDPAYAPSYVGLAETYDLLPEFGTTPASDAFPKGIAAAETAVRLDPNSADAHRVLAFGLFYWEWKTARAFNEFDRSLQLDAGNVETHHWYANALLAVRRVDDADRQIRLARDLNPTSISILADQAQIEALLPGKLDDSLATLRGLERDDPHFEASERYIASILFLMQQYGPWVEQLQRIAEETHLPKDVGLAEAARQGWRNESEAELLQAVRRVQEVPDAGRVTSFEFVTTCIRLGDLRAAMQGLQTAYDAHDFLVIVFVSDPASAKLDSVPAYLKMRGELESRMNAAT